MQKVNLIVVAHPDDEILGFGATGPRMAAAGELVQAVILCGAADKRTRRPQDEELFQDIQEANRTAGFAPPVLGPFPNLRLNTVSHVDLVMFIEEQIRTFQPHRIFTHHPEDLNDDHRQISRAAQAASRLFQRVGNLRPLEALYFMEILSSTEWGFPQGGAGFCPNTYLESGPFLDTKLVALRCYRDVMREAPHPRSETVLKGLAAYRGAQCGRPFAEAFQCVFQTDLS